MIDPREERDPAERDPAVDELREEDVTAADRLDDRISEGEGLPDDADGDR